MCLQMKEYLHICIYLLGVCLFARAIAQYDSLLALKIPNHIRTFLLIFSFRKERISVFCVISQIYAYIMMLLFVISRFRSLTFLYMFSVDPNTLYNNLLKFHYIILIPVAIMELGLCALKKWFKN